MYSEQQGFLAESSDTLGGVSDRFVSSLFVALARHDIAPTGLIGDLPIAIDEDGRALDPVPWDSFCELLRRLENHVGGSDGLELCGEWLCSGPQPLRLSGFIAFVTSPASLYRAAAGVGLRRAIPGLEVLVMPAEDNRLRLDIRLSDALRPCPQLLHITTGAARALPRLLEMPDSIVSAKIEDRHAEYDVTIPSSRTGVARMRRMFRSILSPGSVLQQLEDRQLELEARHARLARAHEELLERERRFSALSDAAVDTICEIDASGRILFISASVRELMGYSREQVTDSHYRLWVTTPLHGFAKERFESLQKAPVGTAIVKERIELHAAHGRRVTVEVSLRSHCTASGEWRAVACLRDAASPVKRHATRRRVTRIVEHVLAREEDAVALNGLKVQSGTRSMSAPRARSFSSIRS